MAQHHITHQVCLVQQVQASDLCCQGKVLCVCVRERERDGRGRENKRGQKEDKKDKGESG